MTLTSVVEVPLPPDGGWGWVVVLASFTCNMILDGQSMSQLLLLPSLLILLLLLLLFLFLIILLFLLLSLLLILLLLLLLTTATSRTQGLPTPSVSCWSPWSSTLTLTRPQCPGWGPVVTVSPDLSPKVGSLLCGVYMLSGPLVGGMVNRLGCRPVCMMGAGGRPVPATDAWLSDGLCLHLPLHTLPLRARPDADVRYPRRPGSGPDLPAGHSVGRLLLRVQESAGYRSVLQLPRVLYNRLFFNFSFQNRYIGLRLWCGNFCVCPCCQLLDL